MNLIIIYFYGFSTHDTVFSITLVMPLLLFCQVTSAMVTLSCLACQPFIIGISVSQEMIHETGTTTDSEHSGFDSTESVHWK